MTINRRWAATVSTLFCAMLLADALNANGGAGGQPNNRGGGGRGPSVGAMRPSAPAGMNTMRPMGGQSGFNSMAGARPNYNSSTASIPRTGMTGVPNGAMRPNASVSRPDLGFRAGGVPAQYAQNFAQMQPQAAAISTRPAFNAAARPGYDTTPAIANRPDLGGISRLPGTMQPGIIRPVGLAPKMNPQGLANQPGTNLAGVQPTIRPAFSGNRPTNWGSNTTGSLVGSKLPPGSNIPIGRPDLGGRPNTGSSTVFKPDISNPGQLAPGLRPNQPGFNRPDSGNRPDWGGNRPGGGDRPGGDPWSQWHGRPGGGNRPNWPDNRPNWNSNNNNWNINNNWTSNHQNIINNSPTIINTGYRPGFAVPGSGYGYRGNWGYGQQSVYDNSWQCGPGWAPAYGALHDDWCHGSWNGYGGNSNWLNYASGAATGWLTSWAFGSRPYSWGYSSYSNPYYSAVSQTAVSPYNYAQPINTETAPPAQDQTAPATATLDQAREAFQNGNYDQALALANRVVASLPNDPTVHEFRALALFALARYDEASQTLYPVLSVGPGWDWTTMSGVYPSEESYTQQLSALENYVQNHPNDSAPRFLLAYHYLTIGSSDAAAEQLRQVVQLKPADNLSRQMLALLDSAKQPAAVAEQAPAQSTAAQPAVGSAATIPPAALVGMWNTKPDDKTSIKLTLQPNGKFTWDVAQQGGNNQLRGNFTIGDGDMLTLAQDQQGGTLAGNIAAAQNGRFTFRLVGAPASDPGVTFVRQL
jgi:tetratricopeptide (TPR) repeat protein